MASWSRLSQPGVWNGSSRQHGSIREGGRKRLLCNGGISARHLAAAGGQARHLSGGTLGGTPAQPHTPKAKSDGDRQVLLRSVQGGAGRCRWGGCNCW